MEDRSWAIGLEQHDFEREYMRRWPHADVIPLGDEWVGQQEPLYRTIDAPEMDKFENDGPAPEKQPEKPKKQLPCRGCGRVFEIPIARAGHERKCKMRIQQKQQKEAAV